MKLQFLGTGGGRYVIGTQKRKTAGILLETEETKIHVDPGPGALNAVIENLESTGDIEGVITSHVHLDHSNDVEPIIEMITEVNQNPGVLFANESVLEGYGDIEKSVSSYHQNLCSRVEKLEEGSKHEFKDVKIESQEMFHTDPKTQGLKIRSKDKTVGFWTDTQYSEELLEFYRDCETLVIYCSQPKEKEVRGHTSIRDVPKIVEETGVRNAIITHFSLSFLNSNIEKQKKWVEENSDCKIIFAEDGMMFPGNRSLENF